MKIKYILIALLLSTSLIGCGNVNTVNNIEDESTFKTLNIIYRISDNKVSDIKIICDTETGLLYLAGINKGGYSPYNHQIISHDGDVITVQYTFDEFKKQYDRKHNTNITLNDN